MTYKKLHTPIEPTQSAVIPYRYRDSRFEVLLITTRNKGKWIVPKGGIERELSSEESAAKEAHEEAGVRGEVGVVSLGCYQHGDDTSAPIVEVFLMRVEREEDAWPEQEDRERRWVPLDDAFRKVEEEGLKSILDEAAALMRLALERSGGGDIEEAHPAIPEPPVGEAPPSDSSS